MKLRLAMWLYVNSMKAIATVCRWLAGSGPETMAAIMATVRELSTQAVPGMAANGYARESAELDGLLSRMAATIRPDSSWTFHKTEWSGMEIMLLPRVSDSNTGLVMGPEGHPLLGSVITNDGGVPNCEPAALNQILHGAPHGAEVAQ